MPDIDCDICNKKYLVEDPNDWRDFVKPPPADRCECDSETKIYIVTESEVSQGQFLCPEYVRGNDCDGYGCTICGGDETINQDEIVEALRPSFKEGYEVSWNLYTPTTLGDLQNNATKVWDYGCGCFGRYDETACLSCFQDEIGEVAEAVHLTLGEPGFSGRGGNITIDVTPYISEDGLSRSDLALWITDGIEPVTRGVSIVINRRDIR